MDISSIYTFEKKINILQGHSRHFPFPFFCGISSLSEQKQIILRRREIFSLTNISSEGQFIIGQPFRKIFYDVFDIFLWSNNEFWLIFFCLLLLFSDTIQFHKIINKKNEILKKFFMLMLQYFFVEIYLP